MPTDASNAREPADARAYDDQLPGTLFRYVGAAARYVEESEHALPKRHIAALCWHCMHCLGIGLLRSWARRLRNATHVQLSAAVLVGDA